MNIRLYNAQILTMKDEEMTLEDIFLQLTKSTEATEATEADETPVEENEAEGGKEE